MAWVWLALVGAGLARGDVEARALEALSAVADGAGGDAVAYAEGAARVLADLEVGWSDDGVRRVFFGVMSEAERGAVLARSRAAAAVASRARGELSALLDDAERRGEFDDDGRRLALERAIVVESAVLPLAGARAGLVIGEVTGDGGAVAAAAEAAAVLRVETAWSRAARGVTLAVAGVLVGGDGGPGLVRRGVQLVAREVTGEGELVAASGRRGSASWGLRVMAALALAAERRRSSGWEAAVAGLGASVREPGVVADARLRFALEEAAAVGGSSTRRGAAVLDAGAGPIGAMLGEEAGARDVGWGESEITSRLAAMVGGGGPGLCGEAITVGWAVEAARRGALAAGVGALEGLIERRGGDADAAGAAGGVGPGGGGGFGGPYREIGWAVLARMRLDLVLGGEGGVDAGLAVEDALLFARSYPASDETAGLLLDGAAAAWESGGVGWEVRERSARAVIAARGRGIVRAEDADYWRVRLSRRLVGEIGAGGEAGLAAADGALELAGSVEGEGGARRELAWAVGLALAGELARAERAGLGGVGGGGDGVDRARVAALARSVRAAGEMALGEGTEGAAWLVGWSALIGGDAGRAMDLVGRSVGSGEVEGGERLLALHVGVRAAVLAEAGGRDATEAMRAWHGELVSGGEAGEREAMAAVLLSARELWGGRASIAEAMPDVESAAEGSGVGDSRVAALLFVAGRIGEAGPALDGELIRGLTACLAAGGAAEVERMAGRALERGVGSAEVGRWFELVRADARLAVGEDAEAFGVYRRMAGSALPGERGERWYWHASARMLQVLARQNEGGSRTEAIRREVRRLRLQPSWGVHGDCCELINGVAASLGIG